jgi:hypothetical protein
MTASILLRVAAIIERSFRSSAAFIHCSAAISVFHKSTGFMQNNKNQKE